MDMLKNLSAAALIAVLTLSFAACENAGAAAKKDKDNTAKAEKAADKKSSKNSAMISEVEAAMKDKTLDEKTKEDKLEKIRKEIAALERQINKKREEMAKIEEEIRPIEEMKEELYKLMTELDSYATAIDAESQDNQDAKKKKKKKD